MTFTNAFLPFATGIEANVEGDSAYAADSSRTAGFRTGKASSAIANKALRQATAVAAMIGKFTSDFGPGNVNDDGDTAALEAQFEAAIKSCLISNAVVITPFASTNSTPQAMSNYVAAQYPIASASCSFGSVSSGVFAFSRSGLYFVGASANQSFVTSGGAGSPGNFQGLLYIYHNGVEIVGGEGVVGSWGISSNWPIACGIVISAVVGDTVSLEPSVGATYFTSGSTNSAKVQIIPLL